MNAFMALISLLRLILAFGIITLVFDYMRTKERQVLYVAFIGCVFFVNDIIILLNIPGFFKSLNHYTLLASIGFILSVITAKWARRRGFSFLFTIITASVFVSLVIASILWQVLSPKSILDILGSSVEGLPVKYLSYSPVRFLSLSSSVYELFPAGVVDKIRAAYAPYSSPHFIIMLLLGAYSAISVLYSIGFLASASENDEDDLTFLAIEKDAFIIALGCLWVALLPFKYSYHISMLASVSFVLVFATYFRAYLIGRLEDTIQKRAKERAVILDLLYDISNAIAENKNREYIYKLITKSALKATDAQSAALFLVNKEENYLEAKVVEGLFAPVLDVNQYVRSRRERISSKVLSDKIPLDHFSFLGRVCESGEAVYIPQAQKDDRVPQTLSGVLTIKSVCAVPLSIQDEFVGVLAVENKEDLTIFTEDDLNLMRTLSDQAAVSINTVHLYETIIQQRESERDIAIAAEIARNLLPEKAPSYEGFEISSFSFAARGVGGDFFDYIDLGEERVGAIMVDVAGKGVPAALVMVMIRSVWRLAAPSAQSIPHAAVEQVNRAIAGDLTEERYATLFYSVFDCKKRILKYANAAHGPMLLYRKKEDRFEELDTEGIPVGISGASDYETKEIVLEEGDIATVYTDGVTEAMNLEREQFTLERLQECIRAYSDMSAKQITDKILKDIHAYVKQAPQHDDMTLMVLKVTEHER